MTEQEHNDEQCTMNNVQWRKVRFGEFYDMLPTNTLSRDNLNDQQGEYQNIHYGDVLIKYPYCLDCNNADIPFINDDVKFNMAVVRDGDVIFADTAEDDTVGKCVEVMNVGDRKIVSGLHTYFCRPRQKMALGYLGYFLNSNHFHNQLLQYIAGSKVSSVNRTSISRTFISYPESLPAQRRIAAILASADKVIAATQKTIAKYKQIKQGMMEDLLNEQCTMNNVQWRKVKLGECCESELGKTLDEGRNTGLYRPYLCALNVLWGKIDRSTIKRMRIEDSELERYLVKKGDLLVCEGGEIGRCAIWDYDDVIYYQNALHRVRFYDGYDARFFMYLLCHYNDLKLIEQYGKGLTIKHLNQTAFRNIPVCVPDLAAQRRIAAILSGIDAKIAAEEKVLEKYEKVKKGLMERLLVK